MPNKLSHLVFQQLQANAALAHRPIEFHIFCVAQSFDAFFLPSLEASLLVMFFCFVFVPSPHAVISWPHSGELWTQKFKVPSDENTDLKRSPFKAWSRSVYSHTCCDYSQGFLRCLFSTLPVHSPAFFPNLFRFLLCWLWLTHGSCVGPQNKIGDPAGGRFPC